jgi:hypothetical protein
LLEAPLLIPLRRDLQIIAKRELRRVNVEGYVEYRASRYQVPPGHRGRTVVLRDDGEHIRIFTGDRLFCEHKTAAGRGQTRMLVLAALLPSVQRELNALAVEQRPLSIYDELSR